MFNSPMIEESELAHSIVPLPQTIQTDIARRLKHALKDGRSYVQNLVKTVEGRASFQIRNIPVGLSKFDIFQGMTVSTLGGFITTIINKAYVEESLSDGSAKFEYPEIVQIDNLYNFLMTKSGKERLIKYLNFISVRQETPTPEDRFYDYIDILRTILISYYSREESSAKEMVEFAKVKMNDDNTYGIDQIRWSDIVDTFEKSVTQNSTRIEELYNDRRMDENTIIVDFQNQ